VRTIFFGTPALSVPALEALTEVSEVVGVVCQPDRPAGRGLQLREPEVKIAARGRNLDILQPEKVRTGALAAWVAERNADVAVVLAYGRILPKDVLSAPRLGCVNLHASLLPRYRGAAPIQWAIVKGEDVTGISLMQMDEGLDTGPVYSQHPLPILPDETALELGERLGALAAQVVREDLPRVADGTLVAVPQDPALATHAPPLEKSHGLIDWTRSSRVVHDLVRGLSPWPGAYTFVRGKSMKVVRTQRVQGSVRLEPGQLYVERPRVLVGTGDGAVELARVKLEGKRELSALELVNGRALVDGEY
jgi:methionyl-tRNA formyltransferase